MSSVGMWLMHTVAVLKA